MSDEQDFEAPVRAALAVVFEAVGNGAFLQIGGLVGGGSMIYGFMEGPERPRQPTPVAEAQGATVAETLCQLADRWKALK